MKEREKQTMEKERTNQKGNEINEMQNWIQNQL